MTVDTDLHGCLWCSREGRWLLVQRQAGIHGDGWPKRRERTGCCAAVWLDLLVHAQGPADLDDVTLAGQTVTVVYRDWGAPVDVTVPSADEVGALSLPTG